MDALQKYPVMDLANNHLEGGDTTLQRVIDAFKGLEKEDRIITFNKWRIRKNQSGVRLANLLVAATEHMQPATPVTVQILQNSWRQQRSQPGFAETVRQALCEQHFR